MWYTGNKWDIVSKEKLISLIFLLGGKEGFTENFAALPPPPYFRKVKNDNININKKIMKKIK